MKNTKQTIPADTPALTLTPPADIGDNLVRNTSLTGCCICIGFLGLPFNDTRLLIPTIALVGLNEAAIRLTKRVAHRMKAQRDELYLNGNDLTIIRHRPQVFMSESIKLQAQWAKAVMIHNPMAVYTQDRHTIAIISGKQSVPIAEYLPVEEHKNAVKAINAMLHEYNHGPA